RITPDDKVLIHRATGGVGRAAIAIARAAGCQVFATADSPQQRQLLRDMGIEYVYDSSNLEFADRIRHDTGGYGVDVVLNSLSGVAQRIGIELLSFGGRFIELGKQDVYGDSRLGLSPFRRNLSLHVVDLALLAHSHPETVQRLLCTVYRNAAAGRLPQPQTTHHPLLDAASALRLADGDDCAATVLLDVPQSDSTVAVVPPAQVPLYRADGSYIVTGGTGGAGLGFACEMAAAGCGRIVLNGDAEPDSQAQRAIERLRAQGADIQVECGDIAEPQTADRLVAAATASGLPVRGVLHAVAAVGDAPLTEIPDHLADRHWVPKVHGAWNLYQALQAAPQQLDWFCVFSSTAALVGSPGQGAAAGADSWLDAFGRWLQSQGLPATVIGWGPWAETGASADGVHAAITSAEAARAFHAVLSHARPYVGYAPITRAPGLAALAHRSPFAEAFRPARRSSPDAQRFLAELQELPREEWSSAILRLVSDQISLLLRRTVDADRSLPEYGLDSLASLEFRTRIETETGVRVGPAQLTTVRGLSQYVCDQLAARVEHANSAGGRYFESAGRCPELPAGVL
ncbi:KR domain-containing protein, partial [Mycobacterium sp. UM_Kg1]|uniref:KR domain-containing protein n=1 Tax=Mycobacterium sp. UM_Kg1 TaxID=1545691 RepID=UPI00061B47B4